MCVRNCFSNNLLAYATCLVELRTSREIKIFELLGKCRDELLIISQCIQVSHVVELVCPFSVSAVETDGLVFKNSKIYKFRFIIFN